LVLSCGCAGGGRSAAEVENQRFASALHHRHLIDTMPWPSEIVGDVDEALARAIR